MRMPLIVVLCISLLFPMCMAAEAPDVQSWSRTFLDAYAREDRAAVLDAVDDEAAVYGSDAAQVFRGRDAIARMLTNDARLWGGTARIGAMRDVTVIRNGDVQSIFFQAPFTVCARPPAVVRFCMVWRHSNGNWLLLQSSNCGRDRRPRAEQLLKPPSP